MPPRVERRRPRADFVNLCLRESLRARFRELLFQLLVANKSAQTHLGWILLGWPTRNAQAFLPPIRCSCALRAMTDAPSEPFMVQAMRSCHDNNRNA